MIRFTNGTEYCCKAGVIGGFEAGHLNDHNSLSEQTQIRIYNDVLDCLQKLKKGYEWTDDTAPDSSYTPAFVTATTTTPQVNAEVVLPLLGFKKKGKYRVKNDHGKEHYVTLWSLNLNTWRASRYKTKALKSIKTPFAVTT